MTDKTTITIDLDDPRISRQLKAIFHAGQTSEYQTAAAKQAKAIRKAIRDKNKGKPIGVDEEYLYVEGYSSPVTDPSAISEELNAKLDADLRGAAAYIEELAKETGKWKGGHREAHGIRKAVTLLYQLYCRETGDDPVVSREYETNFVVGPFADFVKETFRRHYWTDAPPYSAIDAAIEEIVKSGTRLDFDL